MKTMFRKIAIVLATIVFVIFPFNVKAVDVPPSTDQYYLDGANVMSEKTKKHVHEKNWAMDDHCGGYIEIVTQEYINVDILDYSVTLFNEWKIGSQDNGILLVVVTQEQKFYVTVGRRLESVLSSYRLEEIFNETFITPFDAGEYDKAIKDTFDALYSVLEEEYGKPVEIIQNQNNGTSTNSYDYEAGLALFVVIFMFMFVTVVIVFYIIAIFTSRSSNGNRYYYNEPFNNGSRYHSYRGNRNSSVFTNPTSSFGRSSGFSGSSGGGSSSGGFRSGGSSSSSSGSSFSGRSSGGSTRGSGFGRR